MVAIVVKKNNLVPFNGKLTAYTVKFSLDTDDGNPNYTDVYLSYIFIILFLNF